MSPGSCKRGHDATWRTALRRLDGEYGCMACDREDACKERDELLADIRTLLHRDHALQCRVHLDECLFVPAMRKKWGVK